MSVSTNTAPTIFIPSLYPKYGKPRTIGYLESFGISALSPAGEFKTSLNNHSVAVLFTNPFDTAKYYTSSIQ